MSQIEVLSERKVSHTQYRNARLLAQLLITARMLRTLDNDVALVQTVSAFIADSVAAFGDGSTLQIEAQELARELHIVIAEFDVSEISQEVQ